jgi:hypothetical protein
MGVTAIKRIDNYSSDAVRIDSTETPQILELDPETYTDIDVWIPWATSAREFNQHRIAIGFAAPGPTLHVNPVYAVWQSDKRGRDLVELGPPATTVLGTGNFNSGFSRVNGDRRLVIDADLSIWLDTKFPEPELPGG